MANEINNYSIIMAEQPINNAAPTTANVVKEGWLFKRGNLQC